MLDIVAIRGSNHPRNFPKKSVLMVGFKIATVITSLNAFEEFRETSRRPKGDSRNFSLIPASIGPRRRLLEFSPQARPSTSGGCEDGGSTGVREEMAFIYRRNQTIGTLYITSLLRLHWGVDGDRELREETAKGEWWWSANGVEETISHLLTKKSLL